MKVATDGFAATLLKMQFFRMPKECMEKAMNAATEAMLWKRMIFPSRLII